jgi:hypothetical protein
MTIPRIIHQTWKTDDVPPEWQRCVASWRQLHPDWEYRLWTDAGSRAFVREQYSYFLPTYDAYPYNIQRADAIRYLALHAFGGLYADLDYECLRPFDPLLEGRSFVIGLEPDGHARGFGETRLLSNALLAAAPRHPFLETVLDHLRGAPPGAITHLDVLRSTGPIMLNAVYRRYGPGDVTVLPAAMLHPLANHRDTLERLAGDTPAARQAREQIAAAGAYGIHYWNNGWCGDMLGALRNPEPDAVAGFAFFPGLDSSGHDLAFRGRDIAATAAWCREQPAVVAFNTDGFAKSYVRPRRQWRRMGEGDPGQGLYLKIEYARRFRRRLGLVGVGQRT